MENLSTSASAPGASARRVREVVAAHLRGEQVAPVYLAGGPRHRAIATLGAAAADVRAAGRGRALLVCTGADFIGLWRDTLRRGMTPIIRRALESHDAVVLDGLEALRDEPVSQWELARLITPGRLVLLAGRGHLHLATWSLALGTRLARATRLCLHDGPCVTDADAWSIVDRVASYYGLSRAALLARRRTAPVVLARQVTMCLLREEGLTYAAIGRLLRRDHATVMHGRARIHHLTVRQPGVRHDLDALRRVSAA